MAKTISPDDDTRLGPATDDLLGYVVDERVTHADGSTSARHRGRAPDGTEVELHILDDEQRTEAETVERRRTLKRLVGRHVAHIVPVRAVLDRGRTIVVTDVPNGIDLETMVARGGPPRVARIASYLAQVARALDAAALAGVTHGDLRPRHLYVDGKSISLSGFQSVKSWVSAHGRKVSGDPAYVAPEVAAGRRGDVRSDVYSLACVFFEIATGRPPFGAFSPDALIACHTHESFPQARRVNPAVPAEFDALLADMAHKDPGRRPASYDIIIERAEDIALLTSGDGGAPPLLVVEEGRQCGLSVPLPEGPTLLGRTMGEGFVVDDGRISRRHALLHREGRKVSVEDLGSRNGIKVNGSRVKEAVLSPGDKISLGDTVLRIDGCAPREGIEVTAPGLTPSSPVRGAFGAKELVHAPNKQRRIVDLEGDPSSVLAAIARLAAHLADGEYDPTTLLNVACKAAHEACRAEAAIVVHVGKDGPILDAHTAADAQVLSIVLPAVERALPGGLSLLTSVRADRSGAWSTVLAPTVNASGRVMAYLVVTRPKQAFEPEDLAALELVADLASRRLSRSAQTEVAFQ